MADEINAGMPPIPGEKPKGHMSTGLAIGIIAAIVILVGGGIWYWYSKTVVKDTNVTIPEKTASLSASASVSASPSSDETANWQTYSNTTKGFSFKYPSTWTESGPFDSGDGVLIYVNSNDKIGNGTEPIEYYIFAKQTNSKPSVTYTTGTVGSYTAYITDQEPSRSGCLAYYLTSNETTYIDLTLCPYDKDQPFEKQSQYVDTFNTILSTFKFL